MLPIIYVSVRNYKYVKGHVFFFQAFISLWTLLTGRTLYPDLITSIPYIFAFPFPLPLHSISTPVLTYSHFTLTNPVVLAWGCHFFSVLSNPSSFSVTQPQTSFQINYSQWANINNAVFLAQKHMKGIFCRTSHDSGDCKNICNINIVNAKPSRIKILYLFLHPLYIL